MSAPSHRRDRKWISILSEIWIHYIVHVWKIEFFFNFFRVSLFLGKLVLLDFVDSTAQLQHWNTEQNRALKCEWQRSWFPGLFVPGVQFSSCFGYFSTKSELQRRKYNRNLLNRGFNMLVRKVNGIALWYNSIGFVGVLNRVQTWGEYHNPEFLTISPLFFKVAAS